MSLIEPGDRVLVPVFGRFGHLLVEIAERCGAEVHTGRGAVGRGRPARAARRGRSSAVAARSWWRPCRATRRRRCASRSPSSARCASEHGALLYADVTASLGGNAFEMDEWGLDAASAGLQKCLAGPSGQRAGEPVGRLRSTGSPPARRSRPASATSRRRRTAPRTAPPSRPTTSTSPCSSTTGASGGSTTTPRPRRCSTPRSSAPASCCVEGRRRARSSATGATARR